MAARRILQRGVERGGITPLWSRDGRELFYFGPAGAMMKVDVELGATWKAGTPEVLFDRS